MSRSWPDIPLPPTRALVERIAARNFDVSMFFRDWHGLLWAYRAEACAMAGSTRYCLVEADPRLLRALNVHMLPFELDRLSGNGLRHYWETDLQMALSGSAGVRGNLYYSEAKDDLMIDHVVILDKPNAALTELAGWFVFNRVPRRGELVSDTAQVQRYRRTRSVFQDTESPALRVLSHRDYRWRERIGD